MVLRSPVASASGDSDYLPIHELNPSVSEWTIQARVTKKGPLRSFRNQRGEGTLFSVDLLDESGGEIRCTAFNGKAKELFAQLDVEGVFTFSGGTLKRANTRWNSLNHDFEVTFGHETSVSRVNEEEEGDACLRIPKQSFEFVAINDLPSVWEGRRDAKVDVIGVVREVRDLCEFTSKKGNDMRKREVVIVDESDTSVEVTFWGDDATRTMSEDNGCVSGVVVAVKQATPSEWEGSLTISAGFTSGVFLSPDHVRTRELRAWHEETAATAIQRDVVDLSATSRRRNSPTGTLSKGAMPRLCIETALRRLVVGEETDERFELVATITFIANNASSPPWYMSCSNSTCRKRVTGRAGAWHCQKCSTTNETSVPRYILPLTLSDATGTHSIVAFDDVAEQVLRCSAAQLMQRIDVDKSHHDDSTSTAFEQTFLDATYQTHVFTIRARQYQRHNGAAAYGAVTDSEVRWTASRVEPLNFRCETDRLLQTMGVVDGAA
jgi:replication factor A1